MFTGSVQVLWSVVLQVQYRFSGDVLCFLRGQYRFCGEVLGFYSFSKGSVVKCWFSTGSVQVLWAGFLQVQHRFIEVLVFYRSSTGSVVKCWCSTGSVQVQWRRVSSLQVQCRFCGLFFNRFSTGSGGEVLVFYRFSTGSVVKLWSATSSVQVQW